MINATMNKQKQILTGKKWVHGLGCPSNCHFCRILSAQFQNLLSPKNIMTHFMTNLVLPGIKIQFEKKIRRNFFGTQHTSCLVETDKIKSWLSEQLKDAAYTIVIYKAYLFDKHFQIILSNQSHDWNAKNYIRFTRQPIRRSLALNYSNS